MWGTAGPGAAAESTVQPSEQRGKLVPTGGLATGTLTPSGEAVRALSLSPYQGLAQTGTAPLMPSGSELVRYETERNPEKLEQAQAEQLAGLQKQKAEADEMYETYSALYGSWSTNAEEKAEALKQKERFAGESRELQKQIDGLRGYTAPSFGERIGKTLRGAGKQYVGSIWDAAGASMPNGTAVTGVYEDQLASLYGERSRTEAWLADPEDEQERVQLESRLDAINSQIAVYEASVRANKGVSEAARDAAAEITHSGAQDIERAKVDAGTGTKLLIDAGVAGAQMLGDAGIGTATGTGAMLPMLVRSFGSGTQEAREKGYSQEQQIALGLASAATEYITEKLYEGLEEMASDVLNPIAEYVITGNWDMQGVDEILRDGAVGVITALAMGGAGKVGETAGRTVQKVSDTVMLSRASETKKAVPITGTAEQLSADELMRESVTERARRLMSEEITVTQAKADSAKHFDANKLRNLSISEAGKYLRPILNRLGITGRKYQNSALDITFEYTSAGGKRSIAHQRGETDLDYTGFALVQDNLEELCRNAYPLEMHPDEKPKAEDSRVTQIATLGSVLWVKDGGIPVRMTIKFYDNGQSKLHIVINRGTTDIDGWTQNARIPPGNAPAKISISDFFNVVKESEEFVKRIPLKEMGITPTSRTGSDSSTDTASEQAVQELREEYRRVRELETARRIAEKFGARLELGSIEGGADGRYQNGVITIDPNTESPVMRVLVHELTHHMERSGLYGKFSQEILSYISEWSQWSNYL